MARVLLLLPSATYRAADFVAAARRLGVELVVASDQEPVLAQTMGDRALTVPLDDPGAAAQAIEAHDARTPIDAVVAVDDQGVLAAAHAGERLGFPHNPPDAAARTRDKKAMRDALGLAEVAQPRFEAFDDPEAVPDVGYPCVIKPVGLSGSRGVIRADDRDSARAVARRVHEIAGGGRLLAEEFVPGNEVAVEGLLRGGDLTVLALFDKPDPLDGPYFEETLYITPSRLSTAAQQAVARITADAAQALGLAEGPIHAEVRVEGERARVIEIAARSIGGLCARSLKFGAGISLEEVILRHALGLDLDDLERERMASGVMMLPVPSAGRLVRVGGQDAARAVQGIVGLEVTIPPGRDVAPAPDGDRYLGFLFARGVTPSDVEHSLRAAHAVLDIKVE
jgi:biotin carboxylase